MYTHLYFTGDIYGTNHRFLQDDNLKHSSNHGKKIHGVECNLLPAESPDLNPTEKLLHELKGCTCTR